jgi:predicted metal-dependent hydrolase
MWKSLIFLFVLVKKCDIYLYMDKKIKDIIKKTLIFEGKKRYLITENDDLLEIKSLKDSIEKKLKKVYFNVMGKELDLPNIDIKIDDSIKDGKIAGFSHPKNGGNALMGIKSKALDDKEYLKWVIVHELIHSCTGEYLPAHKEHDGLFDKIADGMGLPEEYRD